MNFDAYKETELQVIIYEAIYGSEWPNVTAKNDAGEDYVFKYVARKPRAHYGRDIPQSYYFLGDYKNYRASYGLRKALVALFPGTQEWGNETYRKGDISSTGLTSLKEICQAFYDSNPALFQTYFDKIDLTKETTKLLEKRRKTKEYSKKSRSQKFLLRDQQTIAQVAMRFALAQHVPQLNSLMKDPALIAGPDPILRLDLRYYSTPESKSNYLIGMATHRLDQKDLEDSGQALFDALDTINIERSSLMSSLLSSKSECCRRFATVYGAKTNIVASLLDKDERVRLLAETKRKQKVKEGA